MRHRISARNIIRKQDSRKFMIACFNYLNVNSAISVKLPSFPKLFRLACLIPASKTAATTVNQKLQLSNLGCSANTYPVFGKRKLRIGAGSFAIQLGLEMAKRLFSVCCREVHEF